MRGLKSLWVTAIQDERGLRRSMMRITALSAGSALLLDIANQLTFFTDWPTAIRSWTVTVLVAGGIALLASRAIGAAQLALWRAKEEVERLSRTDPLTGLLNRRALLGSGTLPDTMTLVIADIDRFKQVNDTHGHLAGDDVIRRVSSLMAETLGDLGAVGRLGGEEFAFMASEVPVEELVARLQAFKAAVEETAIAAKGEAVRITISAGLALRQQGQSFESLYAEADRALYAAKASGRNRIVLAQAGDLSPIVASQSPRLARQAA